MDVEDHRPKWGQRCSLYCCLPQRVVIAVMGFLGGVTAFTNRISISHAITVLAVHINRTRGNDSHQNTYCPNENAEAHTDSSEGIYKWSEELQGFILGSFYIGYLISHLPGGILADKYGCKWVLGLCIFCSGLCTLLTPLCITLGGAYALIAVRIMMGLAQGPIFPSLTALISSWVPKRERATLGALCFSGGTSGTIVSNLCSGLMLHSLPWPFTFYIFGSCTVLWFIVFSLLCSSNPFVHPFIKLKEVNYLMETMGKLDKKKPPIPWKRLLFSRAMLGLTLSQVGHDWGYYVMITCLPKYMSDVLSFSIRSNGLYTALPYIGMQISTIISGIVADWLIRTGKMSLIFERKSATFFAAFFPGLFMVIASYAGCHKATVVTLFTICMFCMGPYYAGQKLTPIDMSPSYSATLNAIVNGLGAIMGLVAPSTVGIMTPNAALLEWRWVFWLAFLILLLSAIAFCILGVAEIQSYDPMYTADEEEKKEEEKPKKG